MAATFKKQYKTKDGTLAFEFIRVFTTCGIRYYVSITGNTLRSYLFHMEAKNGRWKIVDAPKVPQWIHGLEAALEESILTNEWEIEQATTDDHR